VKRFFNLFVLVQPEQRLVIVLVLLLVAGAWFKHYRDLNNTVPFQPTPSPSPLSQGAAVYKPPF
jgi:hypothetical protein